MADCPKDIIEVRRNEDGSLDEIVAGDATGDGLCIHLEQMDDRCFWLGISHKGYRQVVWLGAHKGKIEAMSEMDDGPNPKR